MSEFDASSVLSEYLSHRFNNREDSFWDREVGKYHASDTGKCLRKTYYEHELGRREREDAYPHFYQGNLIEDFVEEALMNHFGRDHIKNSFRIELDFDGFKIVGQTDPVLVGSNGKIERLFEVKSTKNLKYRRDGPPNHHVMQVHPYLAGLDLDSCTVIYVGKYGLDALSHEISFDKPTFERGIDRIRRLHSALTNGEPPEAEPFSDWECRFCEYSEECPNGGDS